LGDVEVKSVGRAIPWGYFRHTGVAESTAGLGTASATVEVVGGVEPYEIGDCPGTGGAGRR
jgi:hypothetical protein